MELDPIVKIRNRIKTKIQLDLFSYQQKYTKNLNK